MSYKLFLDDIRSPRDCVEYMRNTIYNEKWVVVKNYDDFCNTVIAGGIPEMVSYDHDLADEHYCDGDRGFVRDDYSEKTGLDCAKWLKQYCRKKDEAHPPFLVHSMNPVGAENIKRHLYGR